MGSFKQDSDLMAYPIRVLPDAWQFFNYVLVFTMTPFMQGCHPHVLAGHYPPLRYRPLSAAWWVMPLPVTVSPAASSFSALSSPCSSYPGIVTLIPQFLVYARLKLTGTYWPWIFGALAGSPYFIFMFRQFLLSFPHELEEAAEVDGAGPVRIFLQIFLPNAKPVLATVMFFAFLGVWGDYLTPLIYLNDNNTLLGVKMATGFKNPQGITLTTVSLAANVIYIIPLVVVFFILQKNILKGVVTSGLKG